MRHVKQIKLVLLIRFCHIIMRMVYPFGGGIWTCQRACLANHDLISFFGIDVILYSSFIAFPPVQRRSGSYYIPYSFSSSVIHLRYLYRAYVAMLVLAITNNSAPFF